MLNRILVAIDQSESSRNTFETALFIAKATDARLMLLHIFPFEETDNLNSRSFSDSHYYLVGKDERKRDVENESYKAKSWEMLRSLHATCISVGINADLSQLLGELSQVICTQARKWGADLIVIGC